MKRNKFMITITDLNGSRNYVLSQLIKKFIFYIVLLIIMAVILTILYINYLTKVTEQIEETNISLEQENANLLEAKKASQLELEALEGKISELGEQYGVDVNASLNDGDLIDKITNVVLTATQESLLASGIPNGDPTKGLGRITDKFGNRVHPILRYTQLHPGLDFGLPMGTPVVATADGVVQSAGAQPGYGHIVEIRHNYGFGTRYGHLNGKYEVKAGDFVKKGDIIAYSGNSGLSTGPHLHYEIRFIQKPLDPMAFYEWDGKNYNEIFKKEGKVQWQSLVRLLSIQTTDKQQ